MRIQRSCAQYRAIAVHASIVKRGDCLLVKCRPAHPGAIVVAGVSPLTARITTGWFILPRVGDIDYLLRYRFGKILGSRRAADLRADHPASCKTTSAIRIALR